CISNRKALTLLVAQLERNRRTFALSTAKKHSFVNAQHKTIFSATYSSEAHPKVRCIKAFVKFRVDSSSSSLQPTSPHQPLESSSPCQFLRPPTSIPTMKYFHQLITVAIAFTSASLSNAALIPIASQSILPPAPSHSGRPSGSHSHMPIAPSGSRGIARPSGFPHHPPPSESGCHIPFPSGSALPANFLRSRSHDMLSASGGIPHPFPSHSAGEFAPHCSGGGVFPSGSIGIGGPLPPSSSQGVIEPSGSVGGEQPSASTTTVVTAPSESQSVEPSATSSLETEAPSSSAIDESSTSESVLEPSGSVDTVGASETTVV
ncbi:hypothetical protein R3P38DRAFT_191419, partial [Favolaschia claudopus]